MGAAPGCTAPLASSERWVPAMGRACPQIPARRETACAIRPELKQGKCPPTARAWRPKPSAAEAV
eukprot:5110545-Pleurochrysis_carterae.AAC.1